jgi:formiminotetrahydrofolate cyclodeaminase
MKKCCEAIDIMQEIAEKGSKLALSDVGVGAALTGAALKGASLYVYINTASMKDRKNAECIEKTADAMLTEYTKKADLIFEDVRSRL